ncbi:MAG TPA: MFS transporter [Solirubrobacteraceae bacterium]|nr:MFS transporter [Solirubrobacteraceae bacterium]
MRRIGPALAIRDFRLWWLAWLGMGIGLNMVEVAIGWEVYAQHRSALDLGWIGLAEFVPMLALALPAGHLADRISRRLVFGAALAVAAGVGVGLALITGAGVRSVLPYLALAVAAGVATALATPAARAMPPTLVPTSMVQGAMTLRSVAGQGSQVLGPALGGLLYGVSAELVYLLSAGFCLAAMACALSISRRAPDAPPAPGAMPSAAPGPGWAPTSGEAPGRCWAAASGAELGPPGSLAAGGARSPEADMGPPDVEGVLDGLRFVRRTPMLLGAILLDLMAVLFGGAVALLPIYARSILRVGASGLGILRAAPAVGALLAAAALTRRPIGGRAGRLLLTVVGLYGVSIIVFGLSRSFELSLGALAVSGFVDLYSVNIRSTTVALVSPDRLRGRVNAIEMVFISASNELGAFESGLAASLVGTVPAVVGGGAVTIALALGWGRLFPSLARMDRLDALRPAQEAAGALRAAPASGGVGATAGPNST